MCSAVMKSMPFSSEGIHAVFRHGNPCRFSGIPYRFSAWNSMPFFNVPKDIICDGWIVAILHRRPPQSASHRHPLGHRTSHYTDTDPCISNQSPPISPFSPSVRNRTTVRCTNLVFAIELARHMYGEPPCCWHWAGGQRRAARTSMGRNRLVSDGRARACACGGDQMSRSMRRIHKHSTN